MEAELQKSIERMTGRICDILADADPSVYLCGSIVLNDFHSGLSDIDILVLTDKEISQEQADRLVGLRQEMLAEEPENPYYRAFEGGILSLSGFLNNAPERVVYWGTSGQRITDRYVFDSFSRIILLDHGILLAGKEVRTHIDRPACDALCADVKRHYDTIRQYIQKTERSLYSFGWFLDISRGLYTLQTGGVTSKTAAGEWALAEKLCPVPETLERALAVRRDPYRYKENEEALEEAASLGGAVQRYADVLERSLSLRYLA